MCNFIVNTYGRRIILKEPDYWNIDNRDKFTRSLIKRTFRGKVEANIFKSGKKDFPLKISLRADSNRFRIGLRLNIALDKLDPKETRLLKNNTVNGNQVLNTQLEFKKASSILPIYNVINDYDIRDEFDNGNSYKDIDDLVKEAEDLLHSY